MAFHYRRSASGESVIPAQDFPLDSAYAATAKVGDVVKLNGSGNLILAVTGDTIVLGVMAGLNFTGIGANPTVGKVHTSSDAIYEAEFVNAGALTVGTAYGIDSASKMDTTDTTVLIVKIVAVVNGKPYVQITARQLV